MIPVTSPYARGKPRRKKHSASTCLFLLSSSCASSFQLTALSSLLQSQYMLPSIPPSKEICSYCPGYNPRTTWHNLGSILGQHILRPGSCHCSTHLYKRVQRTWPCDPTLCLLSTIHTRLYSLCLRQKHGRPNYWPGLSGARLRGSGCAQRDHSRRHHHFEGTPSISRPSSSPDGWRNNSRTYCRRSTKSIHYLEMDRVDQPASVRDRISSGRPLPEAENNRSIFPAKAATIGLEWVASFYHRLHVVHLPARVGRRDVPMVLLEDITSPLPRSRHPLHFWVVRIQVKGAGLSVPNIQEPHCVDHPSRLIPTRLGDLQHHLLPALVLPGRIPKHAVASRRINTTALRHIRPFWDHLGGRG